MKSIYWNILLISILSANQGLAHSMTRDSFDVVVYGGTASGVVAAYTARMMGRSVLLVEPGNRLGGLSSGGLGYTDIGNKYAIRGLALDFYRQVGRHYGKFEQWIFEPHVAAHIFSAWVRRSATQVLYHYRITGAELQNGLIQSISLQPCSSQAGPGRVIHALIFIDCSYEGDLMAKSGVSYTVGRESNDVYQETYNGVQLREHHQFPDGIDPYLMAGNPASGLLWGISPQPLQPQGSGDSRVQSYNFRICLTSEPSNRIAIEKPARYEPAHYELLARLMEKIPEPGLHNFLDVNWMPHHKTDINNNGPFSTDMIGMNDDYPEADYDRRETIRREHEEYVKGLLYFLGHDKRVPARVRNEILPLGYPKDEYQQDNHWSPQMYVREARRMVGAYVMTQANCEGRTRVMDGIGMAAYTMDSHNCQRIVWKGMVKNEGDVQIGGFGPYPISYRAILPRQDQCRNLLVPVCLSASHIAYGSIRMEPVFMELGQAAGVAAVLAIRSGKSPGELEAGRIQRELSVNPLADGTPPDILVDNDDPGVIQEGAWKRETTLGYGPSRLVDDHREHVRKAVHFYPSVTSAGTYRLLVYFPALENPSSKTCIRVFDGGKQTERFISRSALVVRGQASGEWVDLGKWFLPAGREKPSMTISNKQADGAIAADAILLVPPRRP